MQLSGQGHLTHEALFRQVTAAGFPVLHPADHHPAAVIGFQSLGSVEVKTVVDGLHIVPEQMIFLLIQLTDDAHIGVAGMELQAHRVHLLGIGQQDILAVQPEKVRALPHLAVLVVAGGQLVDIFPVDSVLTLEIQDAAAGVRGAVAHHHVVHPVLPPDFGVAEIVDTAAFRDVLGTDDRICFVFLVVYTVTDGDALGLERIDFSVLPAHIANTGIHQQMPSVGHLHRAAGEAAVLVIIHVRGYGDGKPLPLDEVLGLHMAPVHGPPLHIVGMILVKEVIFAFIGRKAVGIVDPADGGGDMELGQL